MIIFNVFYTSSNRVENDDTFAENPFKKSQLEALFELKSLAQFHRTFELYVKNEEQVNAMFDHVATLIRKEKAKKRRICCRQPSKKSE